MLDAFHPVEVVTSLENLEYSGSYLNVENTELLAISVQLVGKIVAKITMSPDVISGGANYVLKYICS